MQLSRRWPVNVGIALAGLLVYQLVVIGSGRVADNRGLGWDGEAYAVMVTGNLTEGKPYPQSRPLFLLAARIPYRLGLNVVQSFILLNYLYAFALYLAAAALLERSGASPPIRLALIVNLVLCIAPSKMFAFYPVQVDLGALALMTVAFYLASTDRLWLAGLVCVLAATSREFAAAVALYGMQRSIRLGNGFVRSVLIYLPTFATLFLIRRWVALSHVQTSAPGVLVYDDAILNLAMLLSPSFLAVYVYFAVTVFGGVSALLAVRGGYVLRKFRAEPELATFLLVVGALAALGSSDIWRYLVFSLPAVLVLAGAYWNNRDWRYTTRVFVAITAFTVITQRSFERMDTTRYFRDWFPLYSYSGQSDPIADLVATWSVRFAAVALMTLALYLMARTPDATLAPQGRQPLVST
ncbi:MAG TPA: hypothetical protein VMS40_26655 [Vicinamibacterales bacterium]|nr:hypothetical protein [Vicinamibacterales bacterium]